MKNAKKRFIAEICWVVCIGGCRCLANPCKYGWKLPKVECIEKYNKICDSNHKETAERLVAALVLEIMYAVTLKEEEK